MRGIKEIEFFKMEGLGNDYVYLLCMEKVPEDLPQLAKDISDRHFGVGSDGLIVVTKSEIADFRMIMFNADGSEAQMCGNASRCIALLVYSQGLTTKKEFTLETRAGTKHLKLNFKSDRIENVSVNMGSPFINAEDIPVVKSDNFEPVVLHEVEMGGRNLTVNCIGMGNPHGVIFLDVEEDYFQTNGPLLENHPIWPEKANIEFVTVLDPHTVRMRVWERGSGETLACGTGACATAVACILSGRTENDVTVIMKGGQLNVRLNDNGEIIMTGDARLVAKGTYYWNHDSKQ